MKSFSFKCPLCETVLKKRPEKENEQSYFCCVECYEQTLGILKHEFNFHVDSFEKRLRELGSNE